jgi:hypothetical protein
VVANSRAELVDAARRILDGDGEKLGTQGHAAWEAGHRWEDIVARYESVFEEVLAAPRAS